MDILYNRNYNQIWFTAGNGSLTVTHDPLTHSNSDPWPTIYDPWWPMCWCDKKLRKLHYIQ